MIFMIIFSWKPWCVGLALYGVVLTTVAWSFHWAMLGEVQRSTERANRTFTRLFVNQNWDNLKPSLKLGASSSDIRANVLVEQADAVIHRFARGTDLVQVKIFDARGTVVYSSDKAVLGNDESTSFGVMNAIKGQTSTELTHRHNFGSLDGDVQTRDLVASYVPIKGVNGVEAVVEIYTDRTAAIEAALSNWRQVIVFAGVVLAAVLLLVQWGHHKQHARLRRIERSHAEAMRLHHETTHELVHSEQEKLRFLWGVTQELHGPSGHILHALHRMEPPLVAGEAVPLMRSAQAQSRALHKRIQDFLTVVQLHRGRLETEAAEFHLGDLIRRMGEQLQEATAGRSLELVVFVSPQVDRSYIGDVRRIEQVLAVLIENAVAVTQLGGIQLRAQPAAAGVEVDVIDTGPGLTKAECQPLNGKQWRNSYFPNTSHASLDEERPRLSLGLIMARGLATVMGGTLEARSALGQGAWFTLRLPLAQAALTEPQAS